jgi:hypothetical protein
MPRPGVGTRYTTDLPLAAAAPTFEPTVSSSIHLMPLRGFLLAAGLRSHMDTPLRAGYTFSHALTRCQLVNPREFSRKAWTSKIRDPAEYCAGQANSTTFDEDALNKGDAYIMCSPAHARTLLINGTMPEDCVVLAGLRVVEQVPLQALPEGMHVQGRLDCSRHPTLTKVHARVRVDGSLLLSWCSALKTIGSNLCVARDCILIGCRSLACIGDGLFVGGDLDLTGCSPSITLPTCGHVCGALVLPCHYDPSRLPDTFKVDGERRISDPDPN